MLPFHPYADLFPLIEGEQFADLVADIKANDVREKIVVWDGAILDGRNRYMAALDAGLIDDDDGPDRAKYFTRFVPAVDGDPLSFVMSKNMHRRHLSIGQRAYAMAEFERFRHGGARQGQDANLRLETASETRAELADKGHVSERSIASAAIVRDQGVTELKAAVKQGAVAISKAEQIARLPEQEQQREVERILPNGSRSIMSSRQQPRDDADYFPTPPWATRALIEIVLPHIGVDIHKLMSAWEPACGEGHLAEVLREYVRMVHASDKFEYGYGETLDYLNDDARMLEGTAGVHWIVTNPPFEDRALQFVTRALDQAKRGVAMFFRSQWAVEGIERYKTLFRDRPPALTAFFVERVNLCEGRWDPDGSTATAYCWLVWDKLAKPMPTFWIPPGCRKALTRDDDRERFTATPVTKRSRGGLPHILSKLLANTGEILQLETAQEVSHSIPECNGQHQPSSLASSAVSIEAADIDVSPRIESAASTSSVAEERHTVSIDAASNLLSKSNDDDLLDVPDFLRRVDGNKVPDVSVPVVSRVEPKSVSAGDGG